MTKSKVAGLLLALFFVLNASLFRVHAVAMSEPLYIFCSLAAFLLFGLYFENSQKRWLILAGCFTGAAYLTRYAGLALFATFLVALILLQDTWRLRLSSSLIFIASFLPWAAAWSIRNKIVADNATNRTLVYHPLTEENIQAGIYNFSEFLIPVESWRRALVKDFNLLFTIFAIIAFIILVWVVFKGLKKFFQPATETPEILSFTNGLYIFGYLASILSSMMLFDASTKFKVRINSPIYVSLLILLVWLGFWLWQKRTMLWLGFIVGATVFLVALSSRELVGVVGQLHKGGQGYASFQWYDSEAMDFLGKLPEGTRIYTNQAGPVYLYTNHPAYVLPDLVDPVTGLPRKGYEEGVKFLQEDVLSGKAVLALFKFGSEEEDVQSIYLQLADGLYLALDTRGDKIYTNQP